MGSPVSPVSCGGHQSSSCEPFPTSSLRQNSPVIRRARRRLEVLYSDRPINGDR
jgi:hypothetical protein